MGSTATSQLQGFPVQAIYLCKFPLVLQFPPISQMSVSVGALAMLNYPRGDNDCEHGDRLRTIHGIITDPTTALS